MKRSVGKSLNRSRGQELHERGGVGIDVVRAGGVEIRIAGGADVHHRRHVQLDHLFVQRIPVPVGERRRVPVPAGGVGIEVAADEAQFLHAALELRGAVGRRHARRLRQLADADEVLGIQPADAMDQIVADAATSRGSWSRCRCDAPWRRRAARKWSGPCRARAAVSVARLSRLSRIWSSLILRASASAAAPELFSAAIWRIAKLLQLGGRGGVVTVTVDDHGFAARGGRGAA